MSEKSTIRRDALRKRDAIDSLLKAKKDALIADSFRKLPLFKDAKTLLYYVSFGSEVDTIGLIEYSLGCGLTVAVPKVKKESSELTIHEIHDIGSLRPGAFGILEPEDDRCEIELNSIDLVVVPGVAFDLQRNRLGYGKGYYDKLLGPLKQMRTGEIVAVALAYEEQIVPSVPSEPHDIKMDVILTDERLL